MEELGSMSKQYIKEPENIYFMGFISNDNSCSVVKAPGTPPPPKKKGTKLRRLKTQAKVYQYT